MARLTLGTAQIIQQPNGSVLLRYMTQGSFLVGERFYSSEQAALDFCRDRSLRVLG
ncbi:hypothetical protein [Bradyrhizobium sp. UFLA03-84]|uniref:hypothetical protein n=1 Tax=Bradyrhizobium sp. UFLA03-84 TaxID=418599 RepID=UPI00130433FF|nr:hypothetical protein [Bradyrhizobium sp. UFLA03-84]